jgi:hypothetical protein
MKNFMNQLTKRSANIADASSIQTQIQTSTLKSGQVSYPRKFGVISQFVLSMIDVLVISDRYQYGRNYLWYHAVWKIMRNAFVDYPVPGINYAKVLVTRGSLWNTQHAEAKTATNAITFTWANDSGIGGADQNDQCILVAYCEALNQCVFTKDGGSRFLGKAQLAVPGFSGEKVHTWLGFISADGERVATSVYTGEVIVT